MYNYIPTMNYLGFYNYACIIIIHNYLLNIYNNDNLIVFFLIWNLIFERIVVSIDYNMPSTFDTDSAFLLVRQYNCVFIFSHLPWVLSMKFVHVKTCKRPKKWLTRYSRIQRPRNVLITIWINSVTKNNLNLRNK